jgi:hypothetical protein
MPQLDVVPSSVMIVCPDCPMCAKQMALVCIEPDRPDHDRRTFDCVSCGYSETVVVRHVHEARAVS